MKLSLPCCTFTPEYNCLMELYHLHFPLTKYRVTLTGEKIRKASQVCQGKRGKWFNGFIWFFTSLGFRQSSREEWYWEMEMSRHSTFLGHHRAWASFPGLCLVLCFMLSLRHYFLALALGTCPFPAYDHKLLFLWFIKCTNFPFQYLSIYSPNLTHPTCLPELYCSQKLILPPSVICPPDTLSPSTLHSLSITCHGL